MESCILTNFNMFSVVDNTIFKSTQSPLQYIAFATLSFIFAIVVKYNGYNRLQKKLLGLNSIFNSLPKIINKSDF